MERERKVNPGGFVSWNKLVLNVVLLIFVFSRCDMERFGLAFMLLQNGEKS